MNTKIYFLFLFILFGFFKGYAQENSYPYAEDIQKFRESDRLNPPLKHSILFVGSSSFTIWQDVQDYFPGYMIINRGFGGSTIVDQIHYINDVVFPYDPKQIVMYCGENDLAYSDTVTAEMVAERFRKWYYLVREKFPDIKITYVSMKPSPSRWDLAEKFREGNSLIREFLLNNENTSYVNVWNDMLNNEMRPKPSIFQADSLHMNKKGYDIWQKAIKPELIK